jgi:hypothetical protein
LSIRLKEQVAIAVERSYNKVERTGDGRGWKSGGQATAARYKAEAEYLQVKLGYLLGQAELELAVGRTPDSERALRSAKRQSAGPRIDA